MPITLPSPLLRRFLGVLGLIAIATGPLGAASAGVAVVRTATWSPNGEVREGAGEFEVMMCAAKLQHDNKAAGIVGVGNSNGMFLNGAERALRFVALRGIPVVKQAAGGEVAADPEGIFIDASRVTEADAAAILKNCLERHGAPPIAVNPEQPTAKEIAAIRAHLQPFREAFAIASAPRVAMK